MLRIPQYAKPLTTLLKPEVLMGVLISTITMTHRIWLALGAIAVLTGCSSASPPPRSIAEQYLEAVKTGDSATAEQAYCHPQSQDTSPLVTALSYEITTERTGNSEGIVYTAVTANVQQRGITENPIEPVELWVWTPDQAFQHEQAVSQKMAALGVRPTALNREEWSRQELCVFVPQS